MSDRNDNELDALYRSGQQAEPPSELDRNILAAAGDLPSANRGVAGSGVPAAGKSHSWLAPRWPAALASAAVVLFSVMVTLQYDMPRDETVFVPEEIVALHMPAKPAPAVPETVGAPQAASAQSGEVSLPKRAQAAEFSELPDAPASSSGLPEIREYEEMAEPASEHAVLARVVEDAEVMAQGAADNAQPQETASAGRRGMFSKIAANRLLADADSSKTLARLAPRLAACGQVLNGLCQLDNRLAAKSADCAAPFELPENAKNVTLDEGQLSFTLDGETLHMRCADGAWGTPADSD